MKISDSIPSTENLPIYYDLYLPDDKLDSQRLPVLIFLHGFKGFKDWGAFPDACEELSRAGFAVVAMNFSLNGVGENMTEFDQLNLFARQTLSQDLNDVGSMIEALRKGNIDWPEDYPVDAQNIGLIGHSRGGHTAVAAAAEYPEVQCLVTWSAVADYNAHWSDAMIDDWEEKGVTEIKNGRTGQVMPQKKVVYEDAVQNANRLMAVERIEEFNHPALFIHSKGDKGVRFHEAEKLFEHCPSAHKEKLLLPDSGHTFDTAHPFTEESFPDAFRKVVDRTQNWFTTYLQ